jgi:hypothetical protein
MKKRLLREDSYRQITGSNKRTYITSQISVYHDGTVLFTYEALGLNLDYSDYMCSSFRQSLQTYARTKSLHFLYTSLFTNRVFIQSYMIPVSDISLKNPQISSTKHSTSRKALKLVIDQKVFLMPSSVFNSIIRSKNWIAQEFVADVSCRIVTPLPFASLHN